MEIKNNYMVAMLWGFVLTLVYCQPANDRAADQATGLTLDPNFSFNYRLDDPDQAFNLPHELEEISGLGISEDGKEMVAVQDEDGVLFFINPYNGEVVREAKFWKDGDYEGVEWVGNTVYVVKSTGTIYEVINPAHAEQQVEKYNFFLNDDNDVEGLAYDKANNRLLLACKAQAGHEVEYPHKKGIYAFDLSTKVMVEQPVYFVDADSVRHYLEQEPAIRKLEKLVEFFDPEEAFGFSPSAIAIHPLTGHLYITSSVGKMLLVLDTTGRILHIEKLSKKVHPQPEGLCFASNGALYLSNEGKGGTPKLYRFNYKPRD
ncbi:MAG: SdiA-regulated domain-containing protein [Phaeodactylibacter sp.]|uniref:SdiA-regulated domain-containing protein n=1 Tax=Phaeodactylibacter sp. TaxID=1940289 RepID=UPI0032ED96AD